MSRFAALAGSLLLLNALLTLGPPAAQNLWPQPTARLSLELCLGVALLVLCTAWRGPARSAWLVRALAALCALFVLLRLVDVLAIGFFGRPLNPLWDLQHIGSVWRLSELPMWQLLAGAALLLAVATSLIALVLACWRALGRGLQATRAGMVVLALCVGALALRGADGWGGLESWRWYSEPVAPALWRQARLVAAQWQPDKAQARLAPSPRFGANLGGLQGADVLIVFAESYGASTLDVPAQAQALAGPRAAFAQAIADSGRAVVSARVRSPTFGGGSWLAHAALLRAC